MNPVSIVTIKSKTPLYKGDVLADKIELINLEETGFDLVSGKDLYQVGDKAIFIQPDYCVSDIPLFESFIRPNGDEKKSYLGKIEGLPRRIRAKKFNFSIEPNGMPVYSNGILLSMKEVMKYLEDKGILFTSNINAQFLQEQLNITKYEEPEVLVNKFGIKVRGGHKFPEGVYKTDEENINNLWSYLEKNIQYPVTLIGTEKVDGSSITIGIKAGVPFICSRNILKPLMIQKHVGRKEKTWWQKLLFWKEFDLNIYEEIENDDDFVKYGKPYLDILINNDLNDIILRGELNGGHLKGSGNRNNPASKHPANIQFFGADEIINGQAVKCSNDDFEDLCYEFKLPRVKVVFMMSFSSKEELLQTCRDYFKDNMIEGIVVRTLDSKFSAKVMNDEYDSKK